MQNPFEQMAGGQQAQPAQPDTSTAASPAPSAPGAGNPFEQLAAQQPQGDSSSAPQGQSIADGGAIDLDNPNDNVLIKGAKGVTALAAGVGQGALDTLAGGANLLGMHGVEQSLRTEHDKLAGQNANNPTLNATGYGGETLAEFMLGDEALKGLGFADKLEQVAKTAKILEKSPKLMAALKVGATAAATQAAQTALRSPGSLVDRVKAGAETGLVTGAVGGTLGLTGSYLSDILTKGGDAAENVPAIADIAGTAKSSPEVIQGLSKKIGDSEQALHADYEDGISKLKSRLEDAELDPQKNPLQAAADKLRTAPIPGDHPATAVAKEAAGEGLTGKVKSLLDVLAEGNDPAAEAEREEEMAEAAKEAAKLKKPGLVDASGKPISSTKANPEEKLEPIAARPYTIDDLIDLRQTIRKTMASFPPGDTNARTLRSLLWDKELNNGAGGSPIDDAIENLSKQSNDPDAVTDYKALRDNYRNHIKDYDEPLIENIRAGKIDDAAKQYVGLNTTGNTLPAAGKVTYNVKVLRNILGDTGLHQFGREVFDTMLKGATNDGKFDPAKFTNLWNRVNEQSKGDQGIFNLNDAANGMAKLAKDAKSAAVIQHLTRAGLFAGGAATGLHYGGLGALLGLTVAEGGGIAFGRDMLNWVATHPNAWKAWGKLESIQPAIAPTAQVATGVAGQVANKVIPSPQQRVYQDATTGLAQ